MNYDVCVVGSGMGGLTTACLLAKEGLKVGVLEQNYLPGGCTSSYWRKGFVFESGATTLVGLDENMPLKYLLEQTGVELENVIQLGLPMQVKLRDNRTIHRHQDLEQWISEAEKIFGKENQRPFWEFCYRISQFVWETSLKQTAFPPSRFSDLLTAVKNANLKQFQYAGYSLMSMQSLLKKYGLDQNQDFVDFVNQQLLITAQNHIKEVNVLFGATALCYTNYSNYYVKGGLINLVNPLVDYLEQNNSKVHLRTSVENIRSSDGNYVVQTKKHGKFQCKYLVSGIPINNTLKIFPDEKVGILSKKQFKSEQLNSAFQMGIGFKKHRDYETIHYQIHLPEPLPEVGAASIFLSLNHPEDHTRTDEPNQMVGSVSTHVHHPEKNIVVDKQKVENYILDRLEQLDLIRKENVVYQHSSTPKGWQKWTQREFGFVGGYPQYMKIKPWQMLDARLDGKRAYLCGDTAYPGQGIPGATLSGIIAFEKLKADHL